MAKEYDVVWDGRRDDCGRNYLLAAERTAPTTGRTWSPDETALARLPPVEALAPIEHGKFRISPNGLTVVGDPRYEEWEEIGHVLAVFDRGLPFIVGDWIRLGEARFGELAAQAIDARAWRPETVRGYVWLAERVALADRMIDRGLPIKHHQLVAALPPQQQRSWLVRALGDDGGEPWSANRLAAAVRAGHDVAPSRFFALVEFPTAERRAEVIKRLELDGLAVRAVDSRKLKGEPG